jgi:peroxiredoxin
MEQLNAQLEGIEQGLRRAVPIEAYETLRQSVEELQRSGIAVGLKAGNPAPDFTLQDATGTQVRLRERLARGPVVLTFYRGGWCPFCNAQLRAYQKVLPQIRELGASLIAVSPQSPDNTLSQTEKEELAFTVASDPRGIVAEQYRVLYEVPESVQAVLAGFGQSLLEYNATDRWVLPVPATFVIDGNGIIRFAHADPNFMRRLEPVRLLQALQALKG